MAEPASKKAKLVTARAPRVRYTIQLEVEPGMEGGLDRLKSRIQRVKSVLAIHARTPQGNFLMMERLVNAFEEGGKSRMVSLYSPEFPGSSVDTSQAASVQDTGSQTEIPQQYVLASGENSTCSFDIHTPSKVDKNYFLISYDAVKRLMETMMYFDGNCLLCGYSLELSSFAVQQQGHCARVEMNCVAGHSLRWLSSPIVSGKFTANLRYSEI